MSCTAAGWQGYARVGGAVLPFLSGEVSENTEIITIPNIGNRSTRSYRNFSKGKKFYNGSVSFVVFDGYSSAVKKLLEKAIGSCIISSGDGAFTLSPAGNTTYTLPGSGGQAAITNISLRGTAGGFIEGSANFLANSWSMSGGGSANLDYESPGRYDDGNMLPWYTADLSLSGFADGNLINSYTDSWSITIENEINPLYTLCNTGSSNTSLNTNSADKLDFRVAKALRYGMMKVTGEIRYWSPTGDFDADDNDGATLNIDLSGFTITVNNLIITSSSVPNSGANSPVLKTVKFQALAGCNDGVPIQVH